VALHDKKAADDPFIRSLRLIEQGSSDERNFVKKGVSWALRSVGARNPALHKKSIELAERLAESSVPPARWVGKDTLRDLKRPIVQKKIARGSAR
jgi:3-methyladenine DNA glycosylase AlkD